MVMPLAADAKFYVGATDKNKNVVAYVAAKLLLDQNGQPITDPYLNKDGKDSQSWRLYDANGNLLDPQSASASKAGANLNPNNWLIVPDVDFFGYAPAFRRKNYQKII
jgi:hypothetical protein